MPLLWALICLSSGDKHITFVSQDVKYVSDDDNNKNNNNNDYDNDKAMTIILMILKITIKVFVWEQLQ